MVVNFNTFRFFLGRVGDLVTPVASLLSVCVMVKSEREEEKSHRSHRSFLWKTFYSLFQLSSLSLLGLVARKSQVEALEEGKRHTAQVLDSCSPPFFSAFCSLPLPPSTHIQTSSQGCALLCLLPRLAPPRHPSSPRICLLPFTTRSVILLSPLVSCPITLLSPPRLPTTHSTTLRSFLPTPLLPSLSPSRHPCTCLVSLYTCCKAEGYPGVWVGYFK